MKTKDLKEWLFRNRLDDYWYVSAGGHLFQNQMTLEQITQYASEYPSIKLQLLHPSMCEMSNPPWVDFELDKAEAPARTGAKGDFESIPEKKVSPDLAGKRGVTRAPFGLKKKNATGSNGGASTAEATDSKPTGKNSRPPFTGKSSSRPPFPVPEKSSRPPFPGSYGEQLSPREAKKRSQWTPEKIGGVAALVALLIALAAILFSGEEADSPEAIAKSINSRVAYYEGQKLMKEHLGHLGQLSFPTHFQEGVFHDQVGKNMFRVNGFVRIITDRGSRFETYDMITEADAQGNWSIVYLKALNGKIEVGAIPTGLRPLRHQMSSSN